MVLGACSRNHRNVKVKELETYIGQTLHSAPHRRTGARHVGLF